MGRKGTAGIAPLVEEDAGVGDGGAAGGVGGDGAESGEGLAGAADQQQGTDAVPWRRWCSRAGCAGRGWWQARRWG